MLFKLGDEYKIISMYSNNFFNSHITIKERQSLVRGDIVDIWFILYLLFKKFLIFFSIDDENKKFKFIMTGKENLLKDIILKINNKNLNTSFSNFSI